MLATGASREQGAEPMSALDTCPAHVTATVTGSVGATYDDGKGSVHVYDRASASCTICAPRRIESGAVLDTREYAGSFSGKRFILVACDTCGVLCNSGHHYDDSAEGRRYAQAEADRHNAEEHGE